MPNGQEKGRAATIALFPYLYGGVKPNKVLEFPIRQLEAQDYALLGAMKAHSMSFGRFDVPHHRLDDVRAELQFLGVEAHECWPAGLTTGEFLGI